MTTTIANGIIDYNTKQGPVWIDSNFPNYPSNDPNVIWGQRTATYGTYPMSPTLSKDTIEFLEMVLMAMGVEMSYDQFLLLSPDERKSLIRGIKINNITK